MYGLMSLQNEAGETLVYIAAENNLLEVFEYLLGFCDFDGLKIRSRSDMNAFHVAAKLGHLSKFMILILRLFVWLLRLINLIYMPLDVYIYLLLMCMSFLGLKNMDKFIIQICCF